MTNKMMTLPKGWREVKLGAVCSIDERNLSSKTPKSYCFNYISLSDIERGKLIESTRYKFENAPSRARRVVQENDVLLATVRPNLQAFYIFRDKVKDYVVSTGFAVLTADSKLLDPMYLFHYLFSNSMMATYHSMNVGSNYPAINSSDIKCFLIVLPPLPEQKAIAALLETCDTAIETTEALIKAKEQRFKWLLKTLISDQQNNPAWQAVKLGDRFDNDLRIEKGRMLTRNQMTNGQYPVVAGGKTYSGYHNEYTHKSKTITISGSGANAGFIWFHDYPIFATDCNVITTTNKATLKYIYYAIKLQQNILYKLQSGGAQPHIYASDIAILNISLPSLSEQQSISRTLDAIQNEMEILKLLAQSYRNQKTSLMQKLLTAQWRVKL